MSKQVRSSMGHNDWVEEEPLAVRLCRLCALRSGRLPGLRFHDHGARAAILVDLVLRRRISRTSSGELIVSTTPTGITSEDMVLKYIEQHPGITTHDILAKAPGRMKSFLAWPEPKGRWHSRRQRVGRDEMDAERQRLDRTAAGDIDSPRAAAVAMLADSLRLVALAEPENVLGECGEAAWIVEECIDYLRLVRYRYEFSVAAASSGGGG